MRFYLASDDGTQHHQALIATGNTASHDDLVEMAREAARTARLAVTG
jgi:hypothetical protein